ncbi:MAG: phenylpyruvate tautomerase MIF-related protein [Bdellovibrio bacteriovorus]
MPTLRIQTNVQIPVERRAELLARASRTVADMLGKPESYVMVILEGGHDLLFAGSPAPAAFLELISLGLPEERTAHFSRTLCTLLEEALGVPAERVYIGFSSPPRHLFGWSGDTF